MSAKMWRTTLFFALCIFMSVGAKRKDDAVKERTGKYIPLFNVVQFDNVACTSQQTSQATTANDFLPSTATTTSTQKRGGTCFTATECSAKGGVASGNCAAGFGVCCLFFVQNTGTVTQNCTYITNPGFPTGYTGTSAITYTINKCNQNVCSIRLDFDGFLTQGPLGITEATGGACRDTTTFTTSATTATNYPVICGANAGQHVYLDIGANVGDTATIAMAFAAGADTTRTWDIKVTQVKCGRDNPPNNCFQYFEGETGQIRTFNFDATDGTTTHLANQLYQACIRQEAGMCCVSYMQCQGVTNSFSLFQGPSTTATAPKVAVAAQADTSCQEDFIDIPGGAMACNSNGAGLTNKFCGNFLAPFLINTKGVPAFPPSIAICDCSEPFQIIVRTDNTADRANPDINTKVSRGVCLNYQQIPCGAGSLQ